MFVFKKYHIKKEEMHLQEGSERLNYKLQVSLINKGIVPVVGVG
jgi:hypothetical protein